MKYENKRNGEVVVLKGSTEDSVILESVDGSTKEVSKATLKRWWKEVSEEDVVVVEKVKEVKVEVKEIPKEVKTKKAKVVKEAVSTEPSPLKLVIETAALEKGAEIFVAQKTKFESIKIEGKMCMAFTFSSKGVNLWMRKEAVGDLVEFVPANHMFDARLPLSEDDATSKAIIVKLVDASIKFQLARLAAKATKVTK